MLVLITYDVNTQDSKGRKRLRKVAGICVDYGVRVQNSVFECVVDSAQYRMIKFKLTNEIDAEKDSLRFYILGDSNKAKIEHIGAKSTIDVEETLIM